MPIIVKPENMQTNRQGDHWVETTLADAQTIGEPAMVARRLSLKPNAHGPELVHGQAEGLLYVISGSGAAHVGGERFPLAPETVLWLEPGDQYQLEAGEDGLEILQGYAPGE
jgi:quercetin dioxygenase-like cupin family protein